MKLIIKPKYQYILMFFYYPLIGTISMINFAQLQKNKQVIVILSSIFGIWLAIDQVIPLIINDNCKIDLHDEMSVPGLLYILIRNILVGGLYIWYQKRHIDFSKLIAKDD